MPSTWEMYGVDANGDGRKDPYNPVDAIFAAARYLKAAGAGDSLRRAIFAYNHADWYVNDVLGRAQRDQRAARRGRRLAVRPDARPLPGRRHAPATPGRVEHQERAHLGPQRLASRSRATATAAACASTRAPAPPVVAVQDGDVVGIGETERLGKLRAPARRLRQPLHLRPPRHDRRRSTPSRASARASATRDPPRARPRPQATPKPKRRRHRRRAAAQPRPRRHERRATTRRRRATRRVAALLDRPRATSPASSRRRRQLPGRRQLLRRLVRPALRARRAGREARAAAQGLARDRRHDPRPPRPRVAAPRGRGQRRRPRAERSSPRAEGVERARTCWFEIRPAGSRAPRIDPKPILDGWRLLDRRRSTAPQRDRRRRRRGDQADAGQILLMSKELLAAARARRPGHHDLRLRAPGHPRRHRRPPRAGDARVPRAKRHEADGHEPALRPRLLHEERQRLRAQLRLGRRHRRDQRHADPRPPGRGLDHRQGRARAC